MKLNKNHKILKVNKFHYKIYKMVHKVLNIYYRFDIIDVDFDFKFLCVIIKREFLSD